MIRVGNAPSHLLGWGMVDSSAMSEVSASC